MLVQVNTDANIKGTEALVEKTQAQVREYIGRFEARITRIEVHLSDENSDKKEGKDAMRCLLEARLANRKPIAVSHYAETLELAVSGAAAKLEHSLTSVLGRLSNH